MTTIAIDIQPQFRFTCMAANANHFLHQPENMVKELNRQADIADKRILVENVHIDPESVCAAVVRRNGIVFAHESGYFSKCAGGCRGANLLEGLPSPADYDHVVELGGDNGFGACFHDDNEARSTGLIEWIYAQKADTVIIGGLAVEEAVSRTAEQLLWYNENLHVIVNLAACHGYTPESTIQTIYKMRKSGISVVANAAEIPAQMLRYANEAWFKVS